MDYLPVATISEFFSSVGTHALTTIIAAVVTACTVLVGSMTKRGTLRSVSEKLEVLHKLSSHPSMKSEAELLEQEVKRLLTKSLPKSRPDGGDTTVPIEVLEHVSAITLWSAGFGTIGFFLGGWFLISSIISSTSKLVDVDWGGPVILQLWVAHVAIELWLFLLLVRQWRTYIDDRAELKTRKAKIRQS